MHVFFLKPSIHYSLPLIVAILLLNACSDPASIRVGVTNSLQDSGVLAALVGAFEKEHALSVKLVVTKSSKLPKLIEIKEIDSAISNNLNHVKNFLNEGLIVEPKPLTQSDYLLVGPSNDPAHIGQAIEPEEALQKINFVGAIFVSRGDDSSTHQQELSWWKRTRTSPNLKNYVKTEENMTATLAMAADQGAYTVVNRGTWLNFSDKKNLKLLFSDTELMTYQYTILSTDAENAKIWEDWLLSKTAQTIIANYRINNQPVFFNIN